MDLTGDQSEQRLAQQLVGQYGGPAFVRRAREMEAAYEQLLEMCRQARAEHLNLVRLRVGTLFALAGTKEQLRTLVASDEDLANLVRLERDVQPQLRVPVAPTNSARVLQQALDELRDSIAFFNVRWSIFVRKLDLAKINELRDGYNRFYLLERECALGSIRTARRDFRRMEPLTADDLLRELPPLPTIEPAPR